MDNVDPERLELTFSTSRRLDGADEMDTEGLTFWAVTIELLPEDEDPSGPAIRVGTADVVVVASTCPDPWDACDATSADLEALASAIWTREGELAEAVEERVDYVGGDVLLLDRIELDPQFRGRGLSLVCVAEIIRVLGRGCSIVATQAMPLGSADLSELEVRRGSAALSKHWTKLGLHPLPASAGEGMLVGDLSMVEIDDARESLRAEVGLP